MNSPYDQTGTIFGSGLLVILFVIGYISYNLIKNYRDNYSKKACKQEREFRERREHLLKK